VPVFADTPKAMIGAVDSRQNSRYTFPKWLAVISLAALLLYLAIRGVEWKRVVRIVSHCRWELLALAAVVSVLSYILRAMRWRVLLNARERIPATTVLWASSVGYLANGYLPARAGELLRTLIISARSQLSKTYVFITAMTERVTELVVLVLMAFLFSFTLDQRPIWLMRVLVIVVLIALSGTALLLVLPRLEETRTGLIAGLPAGNFRDRLHRMAESVTLGLSAMRSVSRFSTLCGFTMGVWTLDTVSNLILAGALGMHLTFAAALLLTTGVAIGILLPSTPGGIGIVQFAAVTVLVPLRFTKTDAIAFILVGQALSYFVVTTLGLVGSWRLSREDR
jgi:hypothetical protein